MLNGSFQNVAPGTGLSQPCHGRMSKSPMKSHYTNSCPMNAHASQNVLSAKSQWNAWDTKRKLAFTNNGTVRKAQNVCPGIGKSCLIFFSRQPCQGVPVSSQCTLYLGNRGGGGTLPCQNCPSTINEVYGLETSRRETGMLCSLLLFL